MYACAGATGAGVAADHSDGGAYGLRFWVCARSASGKAALTSHVARTLEGVASVYVDATGAAVGETTTTDTDEVQEIEKQGLSGRWQTASTSYRCAIVQIAA
jgi:hypothetical protein